MVEYTGQYYYDNIAFKETSLFNTDGLNSGITLYEVLRIYKGKYLFLEDHMQRLQESVSLSGYSYMVPIALIHNILRNLIMKNRFSDGNVKIVLQFKACDRPLFYAYFIPHTYPTPVMYKDGVSIDLYKAVRSNPNVKRLLPDVRQLVSEFIKAQIVYDALFVDEDDTITEGSKTNVFFIQGESIHTPPGDRVLKGITRSKVIYLCSQLNFNLIERPISIDSLNIFEAAFLTGTSPKVLPIRKIGNLVYNVSNPLLKALMEAYNDLIDSYIGPE